MQAERTKLYEESPIVPRISIITVALNSKDSLQKCIDSVAIQQNCSVEHIVVDGGSSDGTLVSAPRKTSSPSRRIRQAKAPPSGDYHRRVNQEAALLEKALGGRGAVRRQPCRLRARARPKPEEAIRVQKCDSEERATWSRTRVCRRSHH